MLVRALANISLCYVGGHGVLFTTMERGNNLVPDGPDLAAEVVARLEPLTTSHLVIDNEFLRNLEPELWQGDGADSRDRGGGVVAVAVEATVERAPDGS